MASQTYLITGANRGIGLGLLKTYALRPNHTIIAAVRSVESSKKIFDSVPLGSSSKIITVKIDSTVDSDPATAVQELKTKYKITSIDVVISNAGLLEAISPTLEIPLDAVRRMLEVNTLGPLSLIQAFAPLLLASSNPRFLVITSSIGSIADMESLPVPFFGYGLSKAAANYLVRKLHFENEGKLISQAFNPGWVQTEMGDFAAKGVGMPQAPVAFDQAIKDTVEVFDEASKEKSGTFIQAGSKAIIPW